MDVPPASQTAAPRASSLFEEAPRVQAGPDAVALTFDDGPDPVWTPRVLEQLGELPATFFVDTSRVRANPDLVRRIADAGHTVGFHCDRHLRHTDLTPAEIAQDAEDGLRTLNELSLHPRLWRAPWGVVTSETRRVARQHGLELWNWSADTHDWRGDSVEKMLAAVGPDIDRGGSVVLMHDAIGPGARRSDCAETERLVSELVQRGQRAGMRFARLSDVETP
jgi:peptidoglycan/xylan/chitin deacetylase (PgdA/CDA1 family)